MVSRLNEPEHISLCRDCPDPIGETSFEHSGGLIKERGIWRFDWLIEKFESDEALKGGDRPYDQLYVEGNMLLNNGINRLIDRLIGVSVQAFDATHCRIGVGNSSTAAAAAQTDLQAAAGSSNRQFVLVDATYPQRSVQDLVVRATFPAGTGTFTWNEAGIDVGTANGTTIVAPLLNRKVISAGAKGAGVAWVITGTATIT